MRSNRRRDWIRIEWYPSKPTSDPHNVVIFLMVVMALVSFIVGFFIGTCGQ